MYLFLCNSLESLFPLGLGSPPAANPGRELAYLDLLLGLVGTLLDGLQDLLPSLFLLGIFLLTLLLGAALFRAARESMEGGCELDGVAAGRWEAESAAAVCSGSTYILVTRAVSVRVSVWSTPKNMS